MSYYFFDNGSFFLLIYGKKIVILHIKTKVE